MTSISDIYWFFKGVKVYALVGESGTGKSFRAKLLAQKYGIELIIDDGLLIRDDKIVAGHSAKREATFLAAVRVALFDEKVHRDTIARALQGQSFKKVLILGTSEKMVNKIAVRLQLPQPQKIIRIEEIATKEEIERAIRSRRVEGKHVIPVPSIEIQRNYPQIFYDRVRVLLKRKQNPLSVFDQSKVYEKSVVRPEFSKTGRVTISEAALTQMVIHCVREYDEQIRIKKLTIKTDASGYRLVIVIDVPFGTQLTGKIHKMQEYVVENIERFTGILIEDVHIIIDKITTN
jgi:adenylate kinase family enzyme